MTLSTTMAPLGENIRWICWTLEPNVKNPNKPKKMPRSPHTGGYCSVTDPNAWASYNVARAFADQRGYSVGYCFHEGDNLFFLDIDNCYDAATGTWSHLAQHLMNTWGGHAAIEVSQSGTGLHVFGYASTIPMHACRNATLSLELYHTERFVAFTDSQSQGGFTKDVSAELASVVASYFVKSSTSREVADWCDEGDGANADDSQLPEIMLRSGKNTAAARFSGDQVDFEALWTGNGEVLGKKWPPTNQNDEFDRSFADSALASHLIYWCGGNMERVERFMRQSALVREKWDDRPVYLENTILNAAAVVKNRAGPGNLGAPGRTEEVAMPGENVVRSIGDPTEDAIAEAFKGKYAGTMKFDHLRGKWYFFKDSAHWVMDNCKQAFHLTRLACRELGLGNRFLGKASTAEGVEKLIRADPAFAVTSDAWDKDPMLLGVPGGTIDLRTGQHRLASPDDMITKTTLVAPAPGLPILWLRVLNDLFPQDPDIIAFLKRFFGYVLTGSTQEHGFLFFLGAGGNGKSTVLNVLIKMLNGYAKTATMDMLMSTKQEKHTTDLAMLQGARLVTASETESGKHWAEARIKAMTGGDPITARFMHRDNFTYTPQFKLLVAGNHAPRLLNIDDAIRRRLFIVPFKVKPSQPDATLDEKLLAELPQILAWCIEGCVEWQRDGLNAPSSVRLASDEYFSAQDIFGQWLEEKCHTGASLRATPNELFNSWMMFANAAAITPGDTRAFADRLRAKGFGEIKSNGSKFYTGLAVTVQGVGA